MIDPMFMIVHILRSFLASVALTAVTLTTVTLTKVRICLNLHEFTLIYLSLPELT